MALVFHAPKPPGEHYGIFSARGFLFAFGLSGNFLSRHRVHLGGNAAFCKNMPNNIGRLRQRYRREHALSLSHRRMISTRCAISVSQSSTSNLNDGFARLILTVGFLLRDFQPWAVRYTCGYAPLSAVVDMT